MVRVVPLTYTTRPLTDRSWLARVPSERSRFTATWSDTLTLLGREVEMVDGSDVVIEVDVRESDIRRDGMLNARAVAATPAVRVSLESEHGPMLYQCDRYDLLPHSRKGADKVWQHNVRAIALTMEALRACDRYGAVDTGQQYQGFLALNAGSGIAASGMTTDRAASIILQTCGTPGGVWPGTIEARRPLVKRAQRLTHPDTGAPREAWDLVSSAVATLERGGYL